MRRNLRHNFKHEEPDLDGHLSNLIDLLLPCLKCRRQVNHNLLRLVRSQDALVTTWLNAHHATLRTSATLRLLLEDAVIGTSDQPCCLAEACKIHALEAVCVPKLKDSGRKPERKRKCDRNAAEIPIFDHFFLKRLRIAALVKLRSSMAGFRQLTFHLRCSVAPIPTFFIPTCISYLHVTQK